MTYVRDEIGFLHYVERAVGESREDFERRCDGFCSSSPVARENARRAEKAKEEGKVGYIPAQSANFAAHVSASSDLANSAVAEKNRAFASAGYTNISLAGASGSLKDRDGLSAVGPVWAYDIRTRDFTAATALSVGSDGGLYSLSIGSASPEDRAAPESRIIARSREVSLLAYVCDSYERQGKSCDKIRSSDFPGIAAELKRAEPTPDPLVSVLGQQVAESELAAALKIVREKNAPPPGKQAPRGLIFRDESFDHRLGAWRG